MFNRIGAKPSRRGSGESKRSAYWAARAIEEALGVEFSSRDLRNVAAREYVRAIGDEKVGELVVSMSVREVGAWRSTENGGTMKVPDYFPKLVEDTKARLRRLVDGGVEQYMEEERDFLVFEFNQRDIQGNLVTSPNGRQVTSGFSPDTPKGKGSDTCEFIEFVEWTDETATAGYEFLKKALA